MAGAGCQAFYVPDIVDWAQNRWTMRSPHRRDHWLGIGAGPALFRAWFSLSYHYRLSFAIVPCDPANSRHFGKMDGKFFITGA